MPSKGQFKQQHEDAGKVRLVHLMLKGEQGEAANGDRLWKEQENIK